MSISTVSSPLISVIIPAYNYASFLPKAINSVLNQNYRNVEIIVIDDGSTDHTRSVMEQYPHVQYFFQENAGLSAARNAGIEKAAGDFLVFLDADDWLEPAALEQNITMLQDNPQVAFVSGNYYLLRSTGDKPQPISVVVNDHHYIRLLECNYIGMHAAVMFRRWVFQQIRYDPALRACEDYDLYLTIARKYPVLHHQKIIATYNFHPSGLSHDYEKMISSLQAVFKKHSAFIQSAEEEQAYQKGAEQWREYQQLMTASI